MVDNFGLKIGIEGERKFKNALREINQNFKVFGSEMNLVTSQFDKDIICHSEGYKMGIASNHSDVIHWFPKYGESMDIFRAAVKKAINTVSSQSKTVEISVDDVIEISTVLL